MGIKKYESSVHRRHEMVKSVMLKTIFCHKFFLQNSSWSSETYFVQMEYEVNEVDSSLCMCHVGVPVAMVAAGGTKKCISSEHAPWE